MKKTKIIVFGIIVMVLNILNSSLTNAFTSETKICPKSDIVCKVKMNGIEVVSEKGKDETALVII